METSFYSWIRKGLGSQITEEDTLGKKTGENKNRPSVQLTTVIQAKSVKEGTEDKVQTEENVQSTEDTVRTEAKTITLSGPGDIVSLNPNAIFRKFPEDNAEAFPINEFPYVEFWEPDFAWRFTPARATGEDGARDRKLRPWLTLIVCKASECSIQKASWGVDLVSFNVENDQDYKKIFPLPTDVWKMAHAQSRNGQNAEICRILGVKNEEMDENTEYRAFLVPVFEIGRLRGLRGPDYDESLDDRASSLKNVPAQNAAWEDSLDKQKNNHESPLTFPAYYSWSFTTGSLSFVEMVRALKRNDSPKSGIDVDVTSLGEGLDYAVLDEKPARNKINMPAALTTVNCEPEAVFPLPGSSSDEKEVYEHLNDLLSKSPVFEENAKERGDENDHASSDDDPWITPPIYGGKHVLATSLNEDDNADTPWLNQVNMDLHYRAAAGLGKKAVQRNQEELVNRAWKQIDAVKALNAELNQKMVSANVNDSVKYMNYKWVGSEKEKITAQNENKMVARMIKNLSFMKGAKFGKSASSSGTSLNEVIQKKKIPEAALTLSFQNSVQKKFNDTTSVLEKIAEGQCYEKNGLSKENMLDYEKFKTLKNSIFRRLVKYLLDNSKLNLFLEWWDDASCCFCRCILCDEYLNSCANLSNENLCCWKWRGVQESLDNWCKRNNYDKDKAAKSFAECKAWKISTCGFTEEQNPGFFKNYPSSWDRVNVYALDSVVFKETFKVEDSTCVVKFTNLVENGIRFYFVDRDRVKNVKFYRVTTNFNSLKEIENVINENYLGSYNILELKTKERFMQEEANALFDHVTLYMPDFVYVKESVLDNQCPSEYNFENEEDFYEKMAKKVGGQNATLLGAWKSLKEFIDKEYKPESIAIKSKKTPSALTEVEALKNGLRDDSAYGRLQECASTYYQTFFGSEKLRKSYLEDCLASKYPIKAYPIFPEPSYYYLKDIADEFILPGIEDLPDDSISVFKGNAAFVESYLCGMNTEMGRELLWREYPTDQRGSYFKKFWDSETTVEDIKKENYFDVKSVHRWDGFLGENHVTTDSGSKGDLLFFAIKGDLMKLYPDTKITLRKALCSYKPKESLKFSIVDGVSVENKGILEPVSQAFVRDDVYVVGFKISKEEAIGNLQNKDYNGYMLVFEKATENAEFEIDGVANQKNNAADFAANSVITTSIVGKHVLTLIGKN